MIKNKKILGTVTLLSSVLLIAACDQASTPSDESTNQSSQNTTQTRSSTQTAALESRITKAKTRINQQDILTFELRTAAAEDAIIIDVRDTTAWDAGHLPGAINISLATIPDSIERLVPDKTQTIYLYCGNGDGSALAADTLQDMGYRDVTSLDGGYRAWVVSGNYIETAPRPIS